MSESIEALAITDDIAPAFTFIDPPFKLNAPDVLVYPQEVSGNYLLRSLCHRLGWPSLSGKRLLDVGCGVRLARTIVNLAIDIDLYAGVDVKADVIAWLKANISDSRLRFAHLDVRNSVFNPRGQPLGPTTTLEEMTGLQFDAACMFSVMTHQLPDDALWLLSLLRRSLGDGTPLYFTAFLDRDIEDYTERNPQIPTHMSTYNPVFLSQVMGKAGWVIDRLWPPSVFQQWGVLCRPSV